MRSGRVAPRLARACRFGRKRAVMDARCGGDVWIPTRSPSLP
jgi:hypothetical protein